jgi:hypothetical protein
MFHSPPKWQRIRNQIDAAMIFARADFVNVHGLHNGWQQMIKDRKTLDAR